MNWLERLIPRVGDRIQRYELLEEVGRGGFGVVFRARQAGLEDDVALKLLLPDGISDPKKLQEHHARFEQEAKLSRELKHPAAIKVRDFGRTNEGLFFLVSEFVEGRDLDDVIYKDGLTLSRIVRIAGQILGCLAEAHHRGIVHRDLKPSNIKVRDIFGEPDSVKILDFGIAKVSTELGGLHTQTGLAFGTPRYMSPEQCRGLRELDGRADLYSLGLILAECIARQPVVQADDPMGIIYSQARPEPHAFAPEVVQSPLYALIWRATQKERGDRYPDALAMRADLPAVVSGDFTGVAAGLVPWQPPPTHPNLRPPTPTPSPSQQGGGPSPLWVQPVSGVQAGIGAPVPAPASARGWKVTVLVLALIAGAIGIGFALSGSDTPSPHAVSSALPEGPEVATGHDGPPATPTGSEPEHAEPSTMPPSGDSASVPAPLDPVAADTPVPVSPDAPTSPANGTTEGSGASPFDAALHGASTTPASDDATAIATGAEEPATPVIQVRIEGSPGRTRVRVAGDNVCTVLPCDFELPRGEGRESVRLSASGYRDRQVNVSRAAGATYVIELEREERPEREPAETEAPAEPPQEPQADPPPPELPPIFYPTAE